MVFFYYQKTDKIKVMLNLFNTLSRKKEVFKPLKKNEVGLYACGPTVYNYAHIGNLRSYLFEDILKRVLIYNGYRVKHIINITDVGHLTDDADEGEDKIEMGAKREGKTANEIVRHYTRAFKNNLKDLNIIEPDKWVRASDHIAEQINLIKKLQEKGYTYRTADGVYYDTSKFKNYSRLARLDISGLKEGARIAKNTQKRNPTDFALWKFSPKDKKRQMEWVSPWGKGFPGWHIECSAMSMKYLGETFDIHAGGIDHIPVHHTNEIAQSEAATGKQFVRYWLHNDFLVMNDDKMTKSKGDFITLDEVKKRHIHPLAYRFFILQAHYRSKLNFSWDALTAANKGLYTLWMFIDSEPGNPGKVDLHYKKRFGQTINDDLNTSRAFSLISELIKPPCNRKDAYATLLEFDQVLGLEFLKDSAKRPHFKPWMPKAADNKIQSLVNKRERARKEKKFAEADKIRNEIEQAGLIIEDTSKGPRLFWKL